MSSEKRNPQRTPSISTMQWKVAGLPFEWWLRYAQASEKTMRKTEELFDKKYPKIRRKDNEL